MCFDPQAVPNLQFFSAFNRIFSSSLRCYPSCTSRKDGKHQYILKLNNLEKFQHYAFFVHFLTFNPDTTILLNSFNQLKMCRTLLRLNFASKTVRILKFSSNSCLLASQIWESDYTFQSKLNPRKSIWH